MDSQIGKCFILLALSIAEHARYGKNFEMSCSEFRTLSC